MQVWFSVLCLVAAVLAAKPRCGGVKNPYAVYTNEPTLVSTYSNGLGGGKRFVTGSGTDTLNVVHVYGSPYQQGVAQGKLFKNEIQNLTAEFLQWVDVKVEEELKKKDINISPELVKLVLKYGLPVLLDMTWKNVRPFTPQKYIDEMQGIADGSGLLASQIINLNMFPEMTKAACTIVGANGNSTMKNLAGALAHLRGLDFSPHCPIKNWPAVTVYHNNTDGSPSVANFGWISMVGVLTGISEHGIGTGEKVWDGHPKHIDKLKGKPWMFMLRDAIEQPNITAAINSIEQTPRTCAIFSCIGDRNENKFRGLAVAGKAFHIFNDTTPLYNDYPQHPPLDGIVYFDKHVQPTGSYCLSDLLKENYGSIDAEVLATTIAPIARTGDMHAVTFDYANMIAYMANAQKTYATDGELPAYTRQFTRLDLNKLFAEQM